MRMKMKDRKKLLLKVGYTKKEVARFMRIGTLENILNSWQTILKIPFIIIIIIAYGFETLFKKIGDIAEYIVDGVISRAKYISISTKEERQEIVERIKNYNKIS